MFTVEPEGVQLHRFSRAEYDRLIELGAFEDEKVELLHGVLVQVSPQGAEHFYSIQRLSKLLRPVEDRAEVRTQAPLIAGDDSEPEPDVAVVPPGDYRQAHPSRAHLIIEVADSSQRKDRTVKGPLYAATGVPEYWIVLVETGVVEVYRQPVDGKYAQLETVARGGSITLLEFPDVTLATADFLP